MAKGHSGNAFSTDFTSMFSGFGNAPAAESPKKEEVKEEKKEAPKPSKAPTPKKEPVKTVKEEPKAPERPVEKAKVEPVEEPKKPEIKTEPVKQEEIKREEPKNEVVKAETKPVNPKSKVAAEAGEVYITAYFTNKEAREYLKYRSTELGMTTSEFFWSIIEADAAKIKERKIDPNDENHEEIRRTQTAYSTSIKIKMDQKAELTKYSVRHRLSIQKYIALVIEQAMLNDAEWF